MNEITLWVLAAAALAAAPAYAYLVVRVASIGYFRSKREFTTYLINHDGTTKGGAKCH